MSGTAALLWLLAVGGAILSGLGQSSAVTFEVVVEHRDGSFVEGLTRDEFFVTVGGRDLLVHQSASDEGPVSVVVMIDISSSASWPGLDATHSIEAPVADNLLAQFRERDRVRIASFGRRVAMSAAFATSRAARRQALKEALARPAEERNGPSPIWDALDEAISALELEKGRRAVVLITDGKATSSHKEVSDVTNRAVVLGIPVSTVTIGPSVFAVRQSAGQTAVVQPALALKRLAASTGGMAVVMSRGDQLPSPLTTIAMALRKAYRLTVITDQPRDKLTDVTIRTRDASHRVRHWRPPL